MCLRSCVTCQCQMCALHWLVLPVPAAAVAAALPVCCAANKQSLEVDWRHMHTMEGMRPVAAACADAPRKVLRLFDEAATEQVFASYPDFEQIHTSVHVRITGLPVDDSIRDLRRAGAGAGGTGRTSGRCS